MIKRHLQPHVESKHEGIVFHCNYCDYKANRKDGLKSHIRIKHSISMLDEGIIFPCEECDFKGKTKSYLRAHIKYKHERNSCTRGRELTN